jgi:hypothetical protein
MEKCKLHLKPGGHAPAAAVICNRSPRSSSSRTSYSTIAEVDPAAATSPADVVATAVMSVKYAPTSATATAATFAATARAQRKKLLGGSLGRLRAHPRLPHLQRGGDQVDARMHKSWTPPLHRSPSPSPWGADDKNSICNTVAVSVNQLASTMTTKQIIVLGIFGNIW